MPVGGASRVARDAGADCAEASGTAASSVRQTIASEHARFFSESDMEGPPGPHPDSRIFRKCRGASYDAGSIATTSELRGKWRLIDGMRVDVLGEPLIQLFAKSSEFDRLRNTGVASGAHQAFEIRHHGVSRNGGNSQL